MFRLSITLAAIAIVFGSVVVSQRAQNKSSAIDEASLKAHVKFLSDDKLEGRGTGAPGAKLAAQYIAEQDPQWEARLLELALIQSAEIGLAIGLMISDLPEKPRYNPGDEFAKP